jgi:DNA polymerase III delta subunit
MKAEEALKNLPKADVYYAHGANLFNKWQLRKKIERSLQIPKTVVFGDDENLFDKAETGGLVPEPRFVVIEEFSEVKNKKALFELIDRAAEGSVYLLQGSKKEKIDVSKSVIEVECPAIKQNERDFISTVKSWIKGANFNLSDHIIKRIYNVTDGDLFNAHNEIQKIALYAHATNSAHLSVEEVSNLLGPRVEVDPFSFSTLFLQKKSKAALDEISKWKYSDVMLQTYNHFKAVEKALVAISCKKSGMKVEAITQETGIPSWYLKFVLPEIELNWTKEELLGALKDCAVAIYKAKKIANLAIPVMIESVLRRCKFGGSVE